MQHGKVIAVAIAGLIAQSSLTGCAAQVAKSKRAAAAAVGATEQCYGIARAGKNDCQTSKHVCAGWSREDNDKGAFVYVPSGTCERLVGGLLSET